MLQAAGVADAVLAAQPPDGRAAAARRRGTGCSPSSAGGPRRGPNGWPQGSLVHQPDLEEVLAAAAGAAPGVTVRRGAEVTGLDQDDDGVTVDRAGTGGADRSVRAAAVLGCDGAGSTVRALIGATMRDLGPGRPLAGARRPVGRAAAGLAGGAPGLRRRAGRRRSCRSPATGTAGSAGWRRGRRSPTPTAPDRLAALLAPVDPARRRDRPGGRVHVPRAGRRPLAGRPGVPGRRRRPPEPAVRRAGARPRAARRAPAGLEAGRRPGGRGRRRPARHLPGRAGAARPGADRRRAAARPADDAAAGGAGDVVRRGVLAVVRRIPAVARLATDSRTPPLRRRPAGRPPRPAPGGGWPARWCRSPRCSSTGGAAGWTTSWARVAERAAAGPRAPRHRRSAEADASQDRRSRTRPSATDGTPGCRDAPDRSSIRPDRIVRAPASAAWRPGTEPWRAA